MLTLVHEAVYEEEIRKSRFIAKAAGVTSPEEAFAFLKRIREDRGNHHCWAYKIGPDYRFSDDGEPSGTAGKPILNAIERKGVDGVMMVVIRYFGGVKLGTGGLVRAYGGCSAKCLQTARFKRIVPATEVKLRVEFDQIGTLYSIIDQFGARKLEEVYTATGLDIKLKISQADCQAMADSLINASAGSIEFLAEC